MRKRFRFWLVKWLFKTGKWVVRKRTTPVGDQWELVDMQRHIAYVRIVVHPLLKNEWILIG